MVGLHYVAHAAAHTAGTGMSAGGFLLREFSRIFCHKRNFADEATSYDESKTTHRRLNKILSLDKFPHMEV
jgi:hypothetical protein